MKYLSIIAAAVLFTLPADLAQAQVKSDLFDEHQYLNRSESVSQSDFSYKNYGIVGFGAVYDYDDTIGAFLFMENWMLDLMYSLDYDKDVWKLKLGRSFMVSGDLDFNFNLYGMAGYSSQEEDTGLMLEGGTFIAFSPGVALGAGYNYDMAIEEEYYTLRAMFFIGGYYR